MNPKTVTNYENEIIQQFANARDLSLEYTLLWRSPSCYWVPVQKNSLDNILAALKDLLATKPYLIADYKIVLNEVWTVEIPITNRLLGHDFS